MLTNKTILVTGGTGSFGNAFIEYVLNCYKPKKVIVYSRDEFKQYKMKQKFKKYLKILRFFIGDVRDPDRLSRAFVDVDYVIHAAALKQVPACEYNPIEAVRTNIGGAENIINMAIDRNVKKVVALSTDKAVNPINLYGATKLVSDKLFIAANAYSGGQETCFSVVRYGNVSYSRGSVIPFFKDLILKNMNELPITDLRMTRFWIYLKEGVDLVIRALNESLGGEIYIAKIPSFKILDLVKAFDPSLKCKEIGIRVGEKVHEVLISEGEARNTYEYNDHYIVYTDFDWWNFEKHFHTNGKKMKEDFCYSSDDANLFLSVEQLNERLIADNII